MHLAKFSFKISIQNLLFPNIDNYFKKKGKDN